MHVDSRARDGELASFRHVLTTQTFCPIRKAFVFVHLKSAPERILQRKEKQHYRKDKRKLKHCVVRNIYNKF